MKLIWAVAILASLLVSPESYALGRRTNSPFTVQACRDLTTAKPGEGVPFQGTVRNSDYHFQETIPRGLTAWGRVAPEALFHGFVTFPGANAQSCIYFEVHVRVGERVGPQPVTPRQSQTSALICDNYAAHKHLRVKR